MAGEEFSIQTEGLAQKGVTLVKVAGYLDAHTFEQLDETINQLFQKNQFRILVDLSGVDYISSAGAGVFIGALQTAQDHEGNIVLMTPTAGVREVFDLLGLSTIFEIVENKEAALSTFA